MIPWFFVFNFVHFLSLEFRDVMTRGRGSSHSRFHRKLTNWSPDHNHWNDKLYPFWEEGDPRWQNCWKGSYVYCGTRNWVFWLCTSLPQQVHVITVHNNIYIPPVWNWVRKILFSFGEIKMAFIYDTTSLSINFQQRKIRGGALKWNILDGSRKLGLKMLQKQKTWCRPSNSSCQPKSPVWKLLGGI